MKTGIVSENIFHCAYISNQFLRRANIELILFPSEETGLDLACLSFRTEPDLGASKCNLTGFHVLSLLLFFVTDIILLIRHLSKIYKEIVKVFLKGEKSIFRFIYAGPIIKIK